MPSGTGSYGRCQVSDEILVNHVYQKACANSNYFTIRFVLPRCAIATATLMDLGWFIRVKSCFLKCEISETCGISERSLLFNH